MKNTHIFILSTIGLGLRPPPATALTNTVYYINNSHIPISSFLPHFPYPEILLPGLTFCEGEETHTITPSMFAITGPHNQDIR